MNITNSTCIQYNLSDNLYFHSAVFSSMNCYLVMVFILLSKLI